MIDHPALGKVKGKASEGVTQYQGIKYGYLKDRFAEATLPDYSKSETIDATKIGPAVLSIPDAVDLEWSLVQQSLQFTDRRTSDVDGLTINITVPDKVSTSSKLPVFAFIHGGGYFIGSSVWPQYDMSRIVRRSATKGIPAIGISFNYRLGAPGFLTSEDLRAEGYKPNNGLRDQRLALQWIQKYISGFGGDPENVTAVGQSAGGASVTYHLESQQPLFKQAVIMGKSDIHGHPVPQFVIDGSYSQILELLGVDGQTSKDKVHALMTKPGDEMLKIPPSVLLCPTVDDDVAPRTPSHAGIASNSPIVPGTKWLKALMIGDSAFDGNVMFLAIAHRKQGIAQQFVTSVEKSMGDHAAELLKIYAIAPTTPDDEAFTAVLRFANDIGFYATTLTYAKCFKDSCPVYMYRFNEKNPWDGQWKGESNHILDLAFLFQNFNEYLSPEQKAVAEGFADKFLNFVAGQKPWKGWNAGQDEKAIVIEGGKLEVRDDVPSKTGRRAEFLELAEKSSFDDLNKAWIAFLQGQ